jgi:hypothetical protein
MKKAERENKEKNGKYTERKTEHECEGASKKRQGQRGGGLNERGVMHGLCGCSGKEQQENKHRNQEGLSRTNRFESSKGACKNSD